MLDVVEISKKVLVRLTELDNERKGGSSKHRLIFPNIFPSVKEGETFTEEELLKYSRISEQEVRFLFVEEFLTEPSNGYYYSVETPTENKYRFGETNETIKPDPSGRSASIDICIFKKDIDNQYKRLLNIEFKNENASKKSISKDILKLMHEKENGAFILLLKNTDAGTLTSVFEKFSNSLDTHFLNNRWCDNDITFIEIIILSLEQKRNKNGTPFLIHRKIEKGDNLNDIFSFDEGLANINKVKINGWKIEKIDKICVGDVEESKAKYGKI